MGTGVDSVAQTEHPELSTRLLGQRHLVAVLQGLTQLGEVLLLDADQGSTERVGLCNSREQSQSEQ